MKNISRNFRRALLLVLVCFVQSSVWGREEVSFNFDWYFHLGELDAVPTSLPAPDAAGWERVDVPHDFQISQPWVEPSPEERPDDGDGAANFKSRLSARAFKEMGAGWYVKSYTPDASLKGQRLLLDFEGIMYVGDVYLNGERIGGTDYGYVGSSPEHITLYRGREVVERNIHQSEALDHLIEIIKADGKWHDPE